MKTEYSNVWFEWDGVGCPVNLKSGVGNTSFTPCPCFSLLGSTPGL